MNLNADYDTYRDKFIKEHGVFMHKAPSVPTPPTDPNNLNAAYEQKRNDINIQNMDYMPYNFEQYQCRDLDLKLFGEKNQYDNDIQRLYDAHDMSTTAILHATDIQLPFDTRKDKSAIHIQRTWRRCINDPSYMMCRKRLMDEFRCMI
jgi:hypothetical protein